MVWELEKGSIFVLTDSFHWLQISKNRRIEFNNIKWITWEWNSQREMIRRSIRLNLWQGCEQRFWNYVNVLVAKLLKRTEKEKTDVFIPMKFQDWNFNFLPLFGQRVTNRSWWFSAHVYLRIIHLKWLIIMKSHRRQIQFWNEQVCVASNARFG